jgi:transcriptional regulator with XRE-family HTH domain
MADQTLGEIIRGLREDADLSLRELAKRINITPPFLSDIELGRRYPSTKTLKNIAKILKTSFDELQKYDHRDSVIDLKRLIHNNPSIGFAFRTAVDDLKKGKLSAEEFVQRVKGGKKGPR